MNKELLIALIYKDLDELKILTKGFSEMENFPKTLVDLSVDKAKSIADCLQKLPLNTCESQESTTKSQDTAIEIGEEKIEEEIFEVPKFEVQIKEEVLEKQIMEEQIEKEVLEEPIIEEEIEVDILEEQQEVEEQIEIVEAQPEIVFEQPKVEEKKELKFEPSEQKIKISDNQPILQNKVADLKQAVSIADRFRFQRELFDGNGEKFSKSLADFNEMETLEQAQNYIVQNLKLDLENPVVQSFINILKRKLN